MSESQRKMQVSLSFLKGPRGARAARIEVMDDVSGQTIAAVDFTGEQFLKLMGSDVLTMTGHTARSIHLALAKSQDC